MNRTNFIVAGALLGASLAAACGGSNPADPGPEPEVTKEARASFPTALALQEKVIARSCTPTGGVCHNMKEYPDMHTPGNFVNIAAKPCNEDKAADPLQYFDGCEPKADELWVDSIAFHARIGSISADQYDEVSGPYREIVLDKAPDANETAVAARFVRDGETIASVPSNIQLVAGSTHARLLDMYDLDYQTYLATETVVGGDPNGNGVFGAENPWSEMTPGKTARSYLLGRITGTVPGSRMPLANQPLSDPEYVAFFCWAETMDEAPQPDDRIDYDHCDFAKHPISYAIGN